MNYVPMNYMETVIITTEIKLTTTTVNATDEESTSLHSKPPLTAALEKLGVFDSGVFAYQTFSPDTIVSVKPPEAW